MVNWQVTAKTVYCNSIQEEITIIVKKDWSVQCTGYSKYREPGSISVNYMKKNRSNRNKPFCEGLECPEITRYKEILLQEEGLNNTLQH